VSTNAPASSAARGRLARVARARMQKSVIVVVETLVRHPRYGKYVRMRSRLMAHDAEGRCREGDLVRIVPSRKRAKRKAWDVVEILGRDSEAAALPAGEEGVS
jgi:small subunit ribosomal protein S17